ncbi:MAG TPA: M20/M25/M40 family metallo-hydrolase, partial [Isosphaeraceae bacterium]|nr:M20/M25/M40 family metallo-hydrolase [Isosphaeraceae bacterium]
MLDHIKVLASDDFVGRAPATEGETKTVEYLVDQFRKMGLEPGNPDGSYTQDVPLVGFQTRVEGIIRVGDERIELKTPEDWVAVSRRQVPEVEVQDSDLVFVGYGVVAPEYQWDDYKGVDVRGKTIVMLVNDPPVQVDGEPGVLDDAMFRGRAMTYYGRWTYKYEIAAEKGAAAALIVHETGPAGYPYEVVSGSWGRENFDLPSEDGNQGRAAIEGWLSNEAARRLFSKCHLDFDSLKAQAAQSDFRPVPMKASANFHAENTLRRVKSQNVVARRKGADPDLSDEYVVFTAHWDHLGKDEKREGDQIFNGAADNASGVAMLLEIAQAFAETEPAPRRSILFLAVTAEEKGLLGARWYAEHPLYPLNKTVADINMDVVNLWGRTTDVTSVGLGQTTLDDVLIDEASRTGRTVAGDPEPEKGMYFRSDHFEFARVGVPALNAKGGVLYPGKPAGFGLERRDDYTKNDYHKVS